MAGVGIFLTGAIIISSGGRSPIIMWWIRLELIIWRFLMGFYFHNNLLILSREMLLKYFLIQRISSIMWLGRFFFLKFRFYQDDFWRILLELVFIFPLLLKAGSFPFHVWIIEICNSLQISIIFLILGIQKIPLVIIFLKWFILLDRSILIKLVVILNIIFSRRGFINFASLPLYIFFSRVNHFILFLLLVRINGRIFESLSIFLLLSSFPFLFLLLRKKKIYLSSE